MQSTTSSTRTFKSSASNQPEPTPPPRKRLPTIKPNKKWIVVAGIVLVILVAFLLVQYRQAHRTVGNNGQKYVADNQKKLAKLILLPTDETPTVATVKDVSKLKSQQFYANAQNGDITFIYPRAKKAILYRPASNIIVNVAPINVNAAS